MVKKLLSYLLTPHTRMAQIIQSQPTRPTRLQLPEHPDTLIELKRTRRKKTIAFRVSNNCIKISAPKRLALYRIQQLLQKRSEWIGKELQRQALLPEEPTRLERQYVDGARVSYLGRRYRLTITPSANAEQIVKMCSGKIEVNLPHNRQGNDEIKGAIARWYHHKAEERLPEIVAQHAQKIGVDYGHIEIRHFKSRWGSCRADGRLQFNWRLMMAPRIIIEYVVIHELCHRIHLNHSPAFWNEVARQMPEFKQHRTWLKTEGHLLTL